MLLLGAAHAHAQQGLVLSGGGSRGLAHAGVLTALEDKGYDPAIVVGTSMGSVVGALYAAGYTPEEIIEEIKSVGWRAMFEPSPIVVGPDHAMRYPMVAIDLSVARFRYSRGLVGQWRINRTLATLLFDANARSRGNFDSLPRTYRPIVADLKTGQAFALTNGDIALAVRASMSVPGAFAPIEWGDCILVDGGIAANLPVGFARELGASHVVAVDVARAPPEIHGNAPLQVIERAVDHLIANAQKGSPEPDVLILPAIDPGLSAASFPDDPTELIEVGRAAGLKELTNATSTQRLPRPVRNPPSAFSALKIEAPDSALASLARSVFVGIAPGE